MYTAAHGKLTIFGDAYNGAELWQTGVRLVGAGAPTTAAFEAVDAGVAIFLATPNLGFSQGFRYTGLKWSPQDVNGRYPDGQDAIDWLRPAPIAGAGQGAYPQICLVLSLRTGRSRGYASNGRMYWPSAQTLDTGQGKIPDARTLDVAVAGAELMADISRSGMGTPAVMSTVGTGRTEVVTATRVGRVMDTQRRRRNNLTEDYSPEQSVPI